MDFLSQATGTNRDVSINLKDEEEVASKVMGLSWYSAARYFGKRDIR
jgi:hypothetical protein